MQQIHIYQDNRFYCYIQENSNSESFDHKITAYEPYSKLMEVEFVWMESINTLFAINCEKILYCTINNHDQTCFEWKVYDIQLPLDIDDNLIIIGNAFQYIIFVYSIQTETIYCLDTLNHEIFTSHKTLPRAMGSSRSCVQTKNHNIHFINHMQQDQNGKHYIMNLMDIIPIKMEQYYLKKVYNPLVFDYISRINKQKILSQTIPVDIIHLILNYIPIFL